MSRFDAVIQEKENPFDKSNRTLKGALEGQKEIERNIDKEESEAKMEKQSIVSQSKISVSAIMGEPEKDKTFRGHTFYLSDQNYLKLKKLAKQQGMKPSKFLDKLLERLEE